MGSLVMYVNLSVERIIVMKLRKKLISIAMSTVMLASVSITAVSAQAPTSETFEVCYATNESTGETTSNLTRGVSEDANFYHTFGVSQRPTPGASDWGQKQAYCTTTYKQFNLTRRDTYSRARIEKGSSISGDSKRVTDSSDGNRNGISSASSDWVDINRGTAHTYYGFADE